MRRQGQLRVGKTPLNGLEAGEQLGQGSGGEEAAMAGAVGTVGTERRERVKVTAKAELSRGQEPWEVREGEGQGSYRERVGTEGRRNKRVGKAGHHYPGLLLPPL